MNTDMKHWICFCRRAHTFMCLSVSPHAGMCAGVCPEYCLGPQAIHICGKIILSAGCHLFG